MIERKALADHSETPEDVASLYSWANLHGAKYRDFSASRAQSREMARQRAEAAIEEEKKSSQQEAEARVKAAEMQRAFEAAQATEAARQAAYEAGQRAAQQEAAEEAARHAAIEEAAQRAARQAVLEQAAQLAYRPPAPIVTPPVNPSAAISYVPPVHPTPQVTQTKYYPIQTQYSPIQQQYPQPPVPSPAAEAEPVLQPAPAPPPPLPPAPAPTSVPHFAAYQPPAPVFRASMASAAVRDESGMQSTSRWAPPEMREMPVRPAWLVSDPQASEPSSSQPIPPAPEGTLQDSRDRVTSRWFALQGVFDGTSVPTPVQEQSALQAPARAPVLAVFSLAGGVGKTSLVATLGRALAAKGERVLLVDTASFGLLPFFFGARDQRVGVLRTFSPPGASVEAPVQMVTYEPETMGPENAPQEVLSGEVQKLAQGTHRVLVDLSTASGATTRRVLRLSPTVLVPVVPDMNSVVSISSIDSFFQHNVGPTGKLSLPYYVLNQFDPSLPLHLDVREVVREQVGDRLLPFAIRRTPAVSEALAEGMTVIDYAPNSTAAEDYGSLASWLKNLAAPASQGYRGVRWSER